MNTRSLFFLFYFTTALFLDTYGQTYTFTKSSNTYSDLTGSISISANDYWDDPDYKVPVGFTFQLFNQNVDTLYFAGNSGGILFGKDDASPTSLIPYGADLEDRGYIVEVAASPISYKLEGSVGSRVLKVEWKNAGFYWEDNELGTLNDYVNFQLWLYEGSNKIEMRYGPSSISNASIVFDTETGPSVGLSNQNETESYYLSGSPSNPSVTSDNGIKLIGTPPNGTVYTFNKLISSTFTTKAEPLNVQVYPNPINEVAVFKINHYKPNNATLNIIDVLGKTVKSIGDIQGAEVRVDCASLAGGIYFYELIDHKKVLTTGKLVLE
jgi:hypothetical protein